ncbi:DUF6507 family protein [Actinoplanes utahensis]|uniref:ESX-1 secretion-associated protein n=1 Tax=Actinoplanes utahensis TaxID=1869 RepID=A0A0A6UU50_ACTUT|nr:DUF6507 family protein [Actinoplanes utahensis]KHD78503.1 hypothetical protein MB27_04645 [Actinoplanes utahensis]GIF31826.1 hypothetical protein Aut01nite_48120 [Actinoplanes utahensis]
MSAWDISPNGVRGVLTRTQGVAMEFDGHMNNLNAAVQGAGAQCSSGIVGEAIAGFFESAKSNIEFVFTRTNACLNAAAQATNAYVDGDLEMAGNAQASATAAPNPAAVMPRGPGRAMAE